MSERMGMLIGLSVPVAAFMVYQVIAEVRFRAEQRRLDREMLDRLRRLR